MTRTQTAREKEKKTESSARTTIEVIGARQNNLKNIDIEIPRDKLTVITGVSGSGKSSLAFDIIYGEAQRRFLKSVSNFAKSRIGQVKKPKVDYVRGLSPVIAIEQKKGNNNPRSTVGTVTDINDYIRLLYATVGTSICPGCGHILDCGHILEPVSASQIAEHICSLPRGTIVELYTPVKKVYGENYDFLFEKIRKKGYKKLLIDGRLFDLSEKTWEPDETKDSNIEIILDRIIVNSELYLQVSKSIEAFCATMEDDIVLRIEIISSPDDIKESRSEFYEGFGCPNHHYVMCETQPYHFSFNTPASSCNTCMGVGTSHVAEPRFMVVNPDKSIMKGALHSVLFNQQSKNSYRTVVIYSLSVKYGFSLDTPFSEYPEDVLDILFYGTKGELVKMIQPPFIARQNWIVGREIPFYGFVNELESWYRNYIRRAGNADAYEPSFVKEAMIEKVCPDCHGARLKSSRLCVTINGNNIHDICMMQFPELIMFLGSLEFQSKHRDVTLSIIREITSRLQLLVDIGLHYLCLARRSDSISGGEMQRIKMSTEISSELMGMLYVMDEPTIGLHPRDSSKVISIMKKLRDIGNTVIVVEHDLETIRNADYLIEVGPYAGIHGGNITAFGTVDEFSANSSCLTGAYITGARYIPVPFTRRDSAKQGIVMQGACENNLKDVSVTVPLGVFVCVTGVSGSGKSTLVFETLYKNLEVLKRGTRIVPGKISGISGYESINNVVLIDQSPIGRNSKSNPATYVGIYDRIRKLFSLTDDAVKKGFAEVDFSLTHANGTRCEHCTGDGVIVTNLQFMADIETICPVCKGRRFSQDGLDIKYHGKNIAEVLEMTVEEALEFFGDVRLIKHKLGIMNELGLGYMTLGQSAPTLSGGEAQRVKLSYELGKIKRGNHNMYIFDEPTTGLHCADIEKLLISIQKLVDQGHSVIVVEHNLDVIKTADYIIDMGPEGGKNGGSVVACGTPEEVMRTEGSHTGYYLKNIL